MRRRFLAFLFLVLPAAGFGQYKPWYNFYNFSTGAKARSMGNAFTAVADDLSAVFWNPAGLATLREPEFYLGYKTTSQRHDYDLQDRKVADDRWLYNFNFRSRLNQIDFFSVSAPAMVFQRPCTFVLGYYRYVPYGFKGRATETLVSLKNRFETERTETLFAGGEGFDVLAFSASASVTDWFFLGATLQQFFNSGNMHVRRVEDEREFDSERTEKIRGRNLIVGLMVAPFPFLRVGVVWHGGLKSRFDSSRRNWEVDRQGKEFNESSTNCQARVVIPEHESIGLLLRPTAWFDLSADYSVIEWDKGIIENYYGSAPMPYPQLDDWSLGQKPCRNLRFGAELRVPFRSWRLHVRGGWSRDRQLYTDESGVAVTVDGLAAGVGCEFSRNLLIEATYQWQRADFSEDGHFNPRIDVGTRYRGNVIFLALTYRFGHIFKE